MFLFDISEEISEPSNWCNASFSARYCQSFCNFYRLDPLPTIRNRIRRNKTYFLPQDTCFQEKEIWHFWDKRTWHPEKIHLKNSSKHQAGVFIHISNMNQADKLQTPSCAEMQAVMKDSESHFLGGTRPEVTIYQIHFYCIYQCNQILSGGLRFFPEQKIIWYFVTKLNWSLLDWITGFHNWASKWGPC